WQGCGLTSHEPAFGQQVEQPDLTQPEIKKLGCYDDPPCGLVIIGTERHEARRIDRQLRGRSGRQGDPGQSVFFLALEDDLMRLFGSDRIARWMDRTGAEEGEVITHPWVTGAIGQAQKRVELQHFQARKKLLEYDDVMNQQREVIYSLRQFALEGGEELKAEALHMVEAAVERLADGLVAEFDDPAQWDRALFETEFLQKFLIAVPDVTDPTVIHNRDALVRAAQQAARAAFQAKPDNLKGMAKAVKAPPDPQQGRGARRRPRRAARAGAHPARAGRGTAGGRAPRGAGRGDQARGRWLDHVERARAHARAAARHARAGLRPQPLRGSGPQRSVSLRQRQEVQEVPRGGVSEPPASY